MGLLAISLILTSSQYEIILDSGDLQIKVNDLIQNTVTGCWEAPGKICIQSEGAQMEYRNIVLIPISRDENKSPEAGQKKYR